MYLDNVTNGKPILSPVEVAAKEVLPSIFRTTCRLIEISQLVWVCAKRTPHGPQQRNRKQKTAEHQTHNDAPDP